MTNEIPRTQSRLWALATDAADGLKDHGTAVGIQQNTEAKVRANLTGAKAAQKAFTDASTAEDGALGMHRSANSNVKAFLALAKRELTDSGSGKLPAGLWPAGTTAIPDDETKRLALLEKIADFLQEHPDAETERKNFTQTQARALHAALTDARRTLNAAVRNRVNARAARDEADRALYERLSGLLSELDQLLKDDSEDWYWFGFTPPAGAERPAKPEGLFARQVGPAALMAGWPHPPRAEKCRLHVQVAGRDADFIPRDWVRDHDDLIEDLPPNATVRLRLEASNATGESPLGEIVELTLS